VKKKEAFPRKYLSKEDVEPPVRAQIDNVKRVTMPDLDSGSDVERNVMEFIDKRTKPFILNSTVWDICELAFGPDSDDWTGKWVELFVDPTVSFRGKRTGGVRIRALTPEPGPRRLAAPPGYIEPRPGPDIPSKRAAQKTQPAPPQVPVAERQFDDEQSELPF
jgi:hypothetical protein